MTSSALPGTDAELVQLARAGQQDAFGELYNRYFPALYDFLHRLMGNREEAADLVQETFLRALQNLASLQQPERFKSWLFSIAHHQALNRIERQQRIVTPAPAGEEDEALDPLLRQVDPSRLANPEQAAEAQESADLVWQAAASLDPRQYALLDLHVRQGLESAEIAEVLGVSKGNAYTMLNRMKKAVEEAIGAFLLARRGSQDCGELQAILAPIAIPPVTPELRRAIDRHVRHCETCTRTRRRLLSPLEILGALAPVPVPLGLREGVWSSLASHWDQAVTNGFQDTGGVGPPDPGGFWPALRGQPWRDWSLPQRIIVAFIVALIALVPTSLVLSSLLSGSDGASPAEVIATRPRATERPQVVERRPTRTPTRSASATPEPAATATPAISGPAPPQPTAPAVSGPDIPPTDEPPAVEPPDPDDVIVVPTATQTPVPDVTGPVISGVSVNPAQIFEDVPFVCGSNPPITSTVTARVSDPSGLASVTLAWSVENLIGSQSMILSGTTAFATIGPFDPDTVDYPDTFAEITITIRAVDTAGAVSTVHAPSVTLLDCTLF